MKTDEPFNLFKKFWTVCAGNLVRVWLQNLSLLGAMTDERAMTDELYQGIGTSATSFILPSCSSCPILLPLPQNAMGVQHIIFE